MFNFLQTRLARTLLFRAAKRPFSKSHHWKNTKVACLPAKLFSRLGWPGHFCLELPSGAFSKSHLWKSQKPPFYIFNFSLDSAGQDISVQSCQAAHFQSPIIVTTQKPPPYMFNFSPDSAGQVISVQSCQAAHFQSPIIVTTQKPPPYMFNQSPDSADQDIVVQSCQAAHFQSQIIGKLRSHLLTCSTFLQTRLARTFLYRAAKRSFFKVPSLEK